MIEYKIGNIVDCDADVIAHQTNCVTTSAQGLARTIFTMYPGCDTYSSRMKFSEPGTITVHVVDEQKIVVNMNAQMYPGKPSYEEIPLYKKDGMIDRLVWFRQCLEKILPLFTGDHALPGHQIPKSIAFPAGIGCGLAGGHWPTYRQELEIFEHMLKTCTNDTASVAIIALPSQRGLIGL